MSSDPASSRSFPIFVEIPLTVGARTRDYTVRCRKADPEKHQENIRQAAENHEGADEIANYGYGGFPVRVCLACQTRVFPSYGHHWGVSSDKQALLVAVGKRIRALRLLKGWTQTDMGVALDLNRGHISDIEQGKREAGLITLQILARGLGTTMAKILKDL